MPTKKPSAQAESVRVGSIAHGVAIEAKRRAHPELTRSAALVHRAGQDALHGSL